jgi:hypothetical protein
MEGSTQVSHDSEAAIYVGSCNTPGCYTRAVNYAGGATTQQLAALIDLSTNCRQFIQVNSILIDYYSNKFKFNLRY